MKARDWDRLAARYQKHFLDIFARDRRKVVDCWLRDQDLLRGRKSVLDVGCGIGTFFWKHGHHFGEKTGVDHSSRMLRIAARRCRSIRHCQWLQADLQRLPGALRKSVDLVVCSNVVTYVSIAECHRAMRMITRCITPGGSLLLVVPSLECHDSSIAILTGRPRERRRAGSAVVRRADRLQRFFTSEGVRRLAKQANMHSVCIQKMWYPWSDEGIKRAPKGAEPPWCWLLTGRS